MTETTDRPRRGRPRPRETIERDARVLKLLEAASPATLTRRQLEDDLGWDGKIVYASIWRLRRDGRIRKVDGNRYTSA